MHLLSKIYLTLLSGLFVLLIFLGNAHYERQIRQYTTDMLSAAEQLGRGVTPFVATVWQNGGVAKVEEHLKIISGEHAAFHLEWQRFDQLPPGQQKQLIDNSATLPVASQPAMHYIAFDQDREKRQFVFLPLSIPGNQKGGLLISYPLKNLYVFSQRTLIETLVVSSVIALLGGSCCFYLIYTKIKKPLDILSKKATEIGKGNLIADLEIKGADELSHLADTMNAMCTRLLIAQEKIHFENVAKIKTIEQLRHTEKLSIIGQIAAGIAHEVGTPLNVIDGRAKMILTDALSEEEVTECATIIKNQAERITIIIRQLLDFSRKKRSNLKVRENLLVLLRQVVHLLSPLAAKHSISLELKAAPAIKTECSVDSHQLQQVFANVIMNGIQASCDNGTVEVVVDNVQMKSLLLTDDQIRNFLRIDIRDEGSGIPEKDLENIFTPFFTTKGIGLGTGLGLSIARELMEENDGWIEARNRRLRGAEISIYLPLEGEDDERTDSYH